MFTKRDKVIALSICHIFETSKPLGRADVVAILKDGAGISYGIPQGTHKSGNLADIIERYLSKRTVAGNKVLHSNALQKILPTLRNLTQR